MRLKALIIKQLKQQKIWEPLLGEFSSKIVLPVLKPVFTTLSVLLFATGLGAMSAPLIVGGEGFQTISPMILTFANSMSSRDLAALLAIFLGISQIILLYFITRAEKKGSLYVGIKSKDENREAKN